MALWYFMAFEFVADWNKFLSVWGPWILFGPSILLWPFILLATDTMASPTFVNPDHTLNNRQKQDNYIFCLSGADRGPSQLLPRAFLNDIDIVSQSSFCGLWMCFFRCFLTSCSFIVFLMVSQSYPGAFTLFSCLGNSMAHREQIVIPQNYSYYSPVHNVVVSWPSFWPFNIPAAS